MLTSTLRLFFLTRTDILALTTSNSTRLNQACATSSNLSTAVDGTRRVPPSTVEMLPTVETGNSDYVAMFLERYPTRHNRFVGGRMCPQLSRRLLDVDLFS
jgi:hypothetical protein